jgi:NodT family efflux transporter outer membrane factor (OMF) lipoprotein
MLMSVLMVGLLAGCAAGPDYAGAPEVPSARAWHGLDAGPGLASTPTGASGELAAWWRVFEDPVLDALIRKGVANNPDLRLATARVREARALRGVAGADQLPPLDAGASASRSRRSETLSGFGGGGGFPATSNLFSAGLDASWEIDVFGAVARGVEAADADLAAAVEGRRDTLVTLLAEVARNYAEARGFQKRLEVNRANVKNQEDSLEIAEARLRAGISGELDVAQSRALLESRRAVIPLLESGLRQSVHRLSVLLGQEPGALLDDLSSPGKIPTPPASVPVGMPSELLLRRPDVRRAERELAAATARIGVAKADLFPRVSLTGSFGFQSGKFEDWTESGSRFWSLGPSVRWNVLDYGRIRSKIQAAGAREEQALASYEKTVLASFEEVENRLVAFTHEQQRRGSLSASVESNARAVALANDLFKAGVRDYLNVVQSQAAWYDAQDQLAQSEIVVTTNLIALYKALGGGWESEGAAEPAPVNNNGPALNAGP